MTIRHKANITQKINDFQVVLSKYSSRDQNIPAPQPLKNNKIELTQPQTLSARFMEQKEVSIKSIDQRINNIMKKHQNSDDYTRTPLTQLSINNDSNHYKDLSIHEIKIQPKSPILSAKRQGLKGEHAKQQWKKLRQRSNKIFQSTEQYQSHKAKENSKYDSQIQKLTQRIKQAEEKKKNLNIQFNPFVAHSKSRPKIQNLSERGRRRPNFIVTPAKEDKEQPIMKIKQEISQFKIQVETPKKLTAERGGGIVKNKHTATVTSSFTPVQFKKQSCIQQRKVKQKKYIKEVVNAFINQMTLDQQLRNGKIWFTFSNQENKWIKLQQKLSSKGFMMSSQACRSKFESTVEQHNPFYRWQNIDFQQGLSKLVSSYDKCQSNWHINILKRWNKENLLEEQLKSIILFEQRKEQIALQDFVRFINTQSGKYYRNRDFHILFKRFPSQSSLQVQFQSFVSALTK